MFSCGGMNSLAGVGELFSWGGVNCLLGYISFAYRSFICSFVLSFVCIDRVFVRVSVHLVSRSAVGRLIDQSIIDRSIVGRGRGGGGGGGKDNGCTCVWVRGSRSLIVFRVLKGDYQRK